MAAGIGAAGYAAFAAVKLAGYIVATHKIRGNIGNRDANPMSGPKIFFAGTTRTLVGMGVGLGYGLLWLSAVDYLEFLGPFIVPTYLGLLFPVRLGEWFVTLKLFFRREIRSAPEMWRHCRYGTWWSYGLDVPAVVFSFVVPGGVWIY